ncbi:MAG: spermidine/putrescine ABC transporter substrate-binding protein [Oceanospirillales bacterium]|nr:spermidine/putrescine ABC transporter substrate-binding protein [Oceanospirillales bacterium]
MAASAVAILPTHASAQESLNLYNWGDYINPEVLTRFTAETGIEVTLDTYGSNEEMLAKLQAGAKGYDIIFPSVHMQDVMAHLGMLEKTDINQYTGFSHVDPAFLTATTDPKGEYCLPYAWGSVGIVYNKKLAGKVTSWKDFFALTEKGQKVTMLDDMRETLGVGLIMNGNSVNSTDPDELKAAAAFLEPYKQGIAAFTYDSIPMVQSGDIAAAHWYVGAMMYVTQAPDTLDYVIPAEGATKYQENMCVLKTAPNKENAIRFLEFFTQPEIAALNTAQQMNGTANKDAIELLPDALKNNPNVNPAADTMSRLQMFTDLGKGLRLYDRVWTRFKTSQ